MQNMDGDASPGEGPHAPGRDGAAASAAGVCEPDDGARGGTLFDWMGATAAVMASVGLFAMLDLSGQHYITRLLMLREDLPVLFPVAIVLALLAWRPAPHVLGRALARLVASRAAVPVTIAKAALAVLAGTTFVALDFPYTRDEAMASFDAAIVSGGRLIASVPAEWRPFVPALQPEFRLEVPGHVAWVSSYLPGNAIIRGVLGPLLGRGGVNALLVATSLVLAFAIARRLFPGRRDAWLLAVVLLATSSQILCMGMTPFAMSAHLTLNLLWLWLFSRDTRLGHAGAIATGFLATGLHQIVFHPLFVAPFLLDLMVRRRFGTVAVYAASYAAIGLFWIGYWHMLLAAAGVEAKAAQEAGLPFLVARVAAMVSDFRLAGLETMAQNLLRFAAWQNPLMVVLGSAGLCASLSFRRRGAPHAVSDGTGLWPLGAGFVLTLVVMFILLPYQASGWGYRYLHGLIGSFALLGAAAWVHFVPATELECDARRLTGCRAWAAAGVLTLMTVGILIPVQMTFVRQTHFPYAAAASDIARADADAVVVETTQIFYGNDLVRNLPDLSNRPKVFDFGQLTPELLRALCARGSVAVFTGRDGARFGIVETDERGHPELARLEAQRRVMRDAMNAGAACGLPFSDVVRN